MVADDSKVQLLLMTTPAQGEQPAFQEGGGGAGPEAAASGWICGGERDDGAVVPGGPRGVGPPSSAGEAERGRGWGPAQGPQA